MTEVFPAAKDVAHDLAQLHFPRFTEADAWALGSDLVAKGVAQGLGIVINIRTPNRTLFHAALAGSAALNDLWAQRKSNTALMFGQASLLVGCTNREKGQDIARNGLAASDYADNGGAVPIYVTDVGMVAVVTVSGLPQVQDHEMVVAGLLALRARMSQA